MIQYFRNPTTQEVFGFDPDQVALIVAAQDNGWEEITNSWPIPLTDQQKRQPFVNSAQAALNKSDTTIIRCVSAGVAVPVAWQSYRNALRAIVNKADTLSTELPATPPYPSGT